jgi:hypothetical protein
MTTETPPHRASPYLVCPFALTVDVIDRMLNFEIADDPRYTGLEVQAFDDPDHGAGILAFASRRDDGCADVYRQPGLVLDPAMFQVGHGVGVWTESAIDPARLDVTDFGVDAEIGLQDRDGRRIEMAIDDRTRRRRRPAGLLAPFGAAVEQPTTLLLAYMRRFDLVRRGGREPRILIDGRPVRTGSLPAGWLHRRRLIKYAADIVVVRLNEAQDGPVRVVDPGAAGEVELAQGDRAIAAVTARRGDHEVRLQLTPPLPDLAGLPDASVAAGTWKLSVDDLLVGGSWSARRSGQRAAVVVDVTRGWKPVGLPPLMRLMTTVVRVFRTWPRTYRWSATISLDPRPTMTSRWERKTDRRDASYRRLTHSPVAG